MLSNSQRNKLDGITKLYVNVNVIIQKITG